MEKIMIQQLIEAAMEAREQSYCPFSGFAVGAALLSADGRVFKGCNVEISGLGATCCAERTAIFKGVSEGCRSFVAIAVTGAPREELPDFFCAPCGICRQALVEFGDPDTFQVILAMDRERYELHTLGELLPFAFKRDDC